MSTTTASKPNSTPSAATSTSNVDRGTSNKTASLLLDMPEEVLVPGALYADCAVVVNLSVKLDTSNPDIQQQQKQVKDEVKESGAAGTSTSTNKGKRRGGEGEAIVLPDDGEYGGELAGRLVWEAYEAGLKVWERENPRPVEEESTIVGGDRKEENEEGRNDAGKQTQTNDEDVYL